MNSKVVPTWNYSAVHVKGRVQMINEPQWILSLLHDLTQLHESTQAKPWAVSDAPKQFVDALVNAIVGIQVEVDELICKEKLSQNQTLENRQGVKDALTKAGHDMAASIKV